MIAPLVGPGVRPPIAIGSRPGVASGSRPLKVKFNLPALILYARKALVNVDLDHDQRRCIVEGERLHMLVRNESPVVLSQVCGERGQTPVAGTAKT